MDLTVLNKNLDETFLIDIYESAIWTDRYYACGDFEIHSVTNEEILNNIKKDYYIYNRDSDHLMIVEKILIASDVEDGNTITISGRSLESILDRRIIWGQKTIRGNLQNGIKELLDDCIISPEDTGRKINNFIFEETTDPVITELTIESQYTGDNLYDVIRKICEERNIGFKVTLNDNKQFVFKLYAGIDRSYDQTTVPYVIFSPNFENLLNSSYVEYKAPLKNITLIGGEGEGADRTYTTLGEGVGLDRRELFTDARDLSSDIGEGVILTEEEYAAQLQQRGKEKLAEHKDITAFEGQAETTTMFKYGVDFFIGDIVQIANEYGHETKARILELVMSEDTSGTSVYPTFATSQEGE